MFYMRRFFFCLVYIAISYLQKSKYKNSYKLCDIKILLPFFSVCGEFEYE